MRRLWIGILPLLVLLPALWADDKPKEKPKKDKPSTPAAQLQEMKAEFQKSLQDAQKAYQEASDDKEREKIKDKFQKRVPEFAGKLLEFAEKNAEDTAAVDALTVVLQLPQDDKKRGDKAVDLLLKHHVDNEKVGPICEMLASNNSPVAEKLCKGLIEKSMNKKVQAYAYYGQARILQNQAKEQKGAEADKLAKEAEELLDKVATNKEAGDLAKKAEGDLFVLRHLQIGKEVPDISGEDSDGKKFKLSDYRGKVVVLDFWANW
jgi:hypothetical protein